MSFFRDPDASAPGSNPDLPWPLAGILYVIMFICIPGTGIGVGFTFGGLKGFGIGLIIGGTIFACNVLLFDWVIERILVSFQVAAQRLWVRVLFNIAGFTWAIGLCLLSGIATLAVMNLLNVAGA